MKLWTVTIETDIAVVADTEDDAWEAAEAAMRDMGPCDHGLRIRRVPPGKRAAIGWEPDCLVYGPDEDITLGEAERRNGEGEP